MEPNPKEMRALKVLLFLAVVAQFSWQPGLRNLSFSSETVGSVDTAPPSPQTQPQPAPQAPAPPAQTSQQNTPTAPQSPHVELPKICGIRFYVTYTEVNAADGTTRTEAKIELHSGSLSNFKPITISFIGSMSTNFSNSDVKQDDDNTIAMAVKRHISNCTDATNTTTNVTNVPTKGFPTIDAAQLKKDREDTRTGMAACRLDSRGNPLTESEQITCQLGKLSDLGSEPADDFNSRAKVMNKVESIVSNNIRKAIKNRLMSTDDSKYEEGRTMLADTLATLNSMQTSMSLDTYRMSRLINGLVALRSGAEIYRLSTTLDQTVKATRDNFRDQLMQLQTSYQGNPYGMQNQMLQIRSQMMTQEQQFMIQAQAQLSNPYYQMVANNRQGYLTASDYSQFVMPYQQLQNDLNSLNNPNQLLYGGGIGNGLGNGIGGIGALGALGGQPMLGQIPGQQMLPANFAQVRQGLVIGQPVTFTPGVTTLTTGQTAPGLGNLYQPYSPLGLPTSPNGTGTLGVIPQGLQLAPASN